MKCIGLLGGTSWPSTLEYYRSMNQRVAERLGGNHSASLLLRSIDYDAIKSRYAERWDEVPALLEQELVAMLKLPIDGLILCNNTLHKAFDIVRPRLPLTIPFFHAVELTAQAAIAAGHRRLLLLATRFTLEDGFFAHGLRRAGLEVIVPDASERDAVQAIQTRLAAGEMRPEFTGYFTRLLTQYAQLDAAVLACTELPLAIAPAGNVLPVLDPAQLQVKAAVDFALA